MTTAPKHGTVVETTVRSGGTKMDLAHLIYLLTNDEALVGRLAGDRLTVSGVWCPCKSCRW